MSLTILCWFWRQPTWACRYRLDHVNALARMLKKTMKTDYRLVCVTDSKSDKGFDCEIYPLWRDKRLVVQTSAGRPNCYQRLKVFDPKMADIFPGKILSLDLDALIIQDLSTLVTNDTFKICKGAASPFNGSMWQLQMGTHGEVYGDFDPLVSPGEAQKQKNAKGRPYYGSDQAWLSYKLKGSPTWSKDDGVLQFTHHIKTKDGSTLKGPPKDCKVIFFAGIMKPWMIDAKKNHPWIYEMYHSYLENRDGN